jgi:perosamine synthetase
MTNTPLRKIHYTQPSITELEVQYATDAAANGWGEHCYDYILRFEEAFKAHLGVTYAIATSSCTGALHMGMHALGIGPGDEVIMADTNWIATAAPIVHLGATPVFVDILPDSWCLDPEQVEAAITPKTKAIVAVHLYGNLCEMDKLLEIGYRQGIPVIEDAAEALGSIYRGKRAGSMGLFGAFSFHGTKTITTGEGGMFVTNNKDLYEHVLTLSNHGRARTQTKQFWPDMVGYKYKMSNIQAAIGCAQIERVNMLVQEKRNIYNMYKASLNGLPLTMNPEPYGCTNSFWMPTIVFHNGLVIRRLIELLHNSNIDARPFFWPLSDLNIPMAVPTERFSLSRSISSRALNLPSPYGLSQDSVDFIKNLIVNSLES